MSETAPDNEFKDGLLQTLFFYVIQKRWKRQYRHKTLLVQFKLPNEIKC